MLVQLCNLSASEEVPLWAENCSELLKRKKVGLHLDLCVVGYRRIIIFFSRAKFIEKIVCTLRSHQIFYVELFFICVLIVL